LEKVLYVTAKLGAALIIDRTIRKVLYASTWKVLSKSHENVGRVGPEIVSFGICGRWSTWTETYFKPQNARRTIGESVLPSSPADANRVWANVEANEWRSI